MVNEVHPEQVHDMINSEEDVILIDVLKRESYRKQHLPKALSIPVPEVVDTVGQITADKGQKIVVYCYNEECQASPKAAEALEDAGYTNVHDMEAGIEGYKEAGFSVVKLEG